MFRTDAPSFQTGPATLSAFDDVDNWGAWDYTIDSNGTVYFPDESGWTVSEQLTPVIQDALSVSPQVVESAYSASSNWETFLSTLEKTIPLLIQGKMQSDLMKINLQRAQQGLAPLDASQYTPGVNVGLTPDTRKLLMYSVLGLGAFVVINSMSRRRGR